MAASLAEQGAFLRAELAPRLGRLRAALRITAASALATVLVLTFEVPHGSWLVFTIFTVSQADAGASLRRAIERLIATAAGGAAGLLAIALAVDQPFLFVALLGVATTTGMYLSQVMRAPYPPLLGALTYVLVALSHVEAPDGFVEVALWRMTAIALGVVIGTGAQLVLWPDDPADKLAAELGRRLDVAHALVDRALRPPGSAEPPPLDRATLGLGDVASQMKFLANAETLHPHFRARNADFVALILEVARLFTGAVWVAETLPAPVRAAGVDPDVRERLIAIRDECACFARALSRPRALLDAAAPDRDGAGSDSAASDTPGAHPGAGAWSREDGAPADAPVLESMERSLDRIAYLARMPRAGVGMITARPPGLFSPLDLGPPPAVVRFDAAALKRALKAALGAEITYLAMLGLAWPGLLTAPVTCLIVAQSTVGATMMKAVLRWTGAIVGGLMGLIVIVGLMPNIHGVTSYVVVLTLGYLAAAWVAVGGPHSAYAGIQMALAFGIMFVNQFGPTTELEPGRDRVIGILLGAAVMGAIDQVLWPVQARSAMRPTVAAALRSMAEVARLGREGATADRPRGLRARVYRTLSAALELREQAWMEGDPNTPATRAERDLILRLVTDAQAAMPGLLAAATERLATPAPSPRSELAEHVEEFERTVADLLDALADAVEGKRSPRLAELRARARELGDAVDDARMLAPVGAPAAGDEAQRRLASRHTLAHQLIRVVARIGSEL